MAIRSTNRTYIWCSLVFGVALAVGLAAVVVRRSADVASSSRASRGASPTIVPGFRRELTKLPVALMDGTSVDLDVLVTRPDVPGKVPLVLINHGSPRDAAERSTMSPTQFAAQSLAFARRGYAAVVLLRRGYGQTAGPYREELGPCDDKKYGPAAEASTDDVIAALHRLRGESWVDADRVVLVGHSAGGLTVTAVGAKNPDGVRAIVSFAGGRGSDRPDHVCQPDRLVALEEKLGSTARIPSLWVYAANDHFFAPALAEQMEGAYARAGGPAELVIAPAFGADGHDLFARAPDALWWPAVGAFLGKLGLPTSIVYARASSVLPAPSGLTLAGQKGFADYAASEGFEKAFATGGEGRQLDWGWSSGRRTREEAAAAAVARCNEHGHDCTPYAIGDAIVVAADAGPALP